MSGSTANEGFPYPLTTDFADVQDAYRLATAVDEAVRAEQAPFRTFLARPSFIARTTATGSGFLAGSSTATFGAIDWDNTGGLTVGASSWSQPNSQQPSWWLFGAMIFVSIVSGTPVVGDMVMGRIAVSTTDQVTDVVSTTNFYQRNDETNTVGEWINFFGMAPIYHGSASMTLFLNGSTQKAIAANSRLWGMYLGPVT